ncbi:MAG: glutathione S-transferase N-terminal domain-containing protein [Hyphomicrobiales bacterium]|nr:glutathione S-transferase N-terminal domain-containing protein [Hyphomicrobiales bacterium]
MTIKIYDAPKSGHCHRVRLGASVMGVPFELVSVAEMEGERTGAEYLALNPFGQIPTLTDGDTVIRDSIAILLYLGEKYAPDSQWIPDDLLLRTRMHEWLAVASGVLFRGPNMARLIKLFGRPGDHAQAVQVATLLFETMDKHLADRTWLVGDQATLADIACYSYIAVANEGELDLAPYANIRSWLEAVEGLENFVPMPRSRST